MGCPDRDITFDFRWQHSSGWMGALVLIWHSTLANGSLTFSQPHPGNRFCWRVRLSENVSRLSVLALVYLSLGPLKGHDRNRAKDNMPDRSRPWSTTTTHPLQDSRVGAISVLLERTQPAERRKKEQQWEHGTSALYMSAEKFRAHPWVKTLSMRHPGPCRGQMDKFRRNHHGWRTRDLVLRRRLETPVWMAFTVRKKSCK